MGDSRRSHRVVYYSAPGLRADMALELAPPDLDVGIVDPSLPWEERRELLRDTEVLILAALAMPTDEIRQLPRLRLLQLMSAGYDRVDVPVIREHGIFVSNNSPRIARSVAEHALGLMLMTQHRFLNGIDDARAGKWKQGIDAAPLFELGGKVVGIVGLGNIGRYVAKMLSGFEPKEILYHDIAEIPDEVERELNVRRVSFEDLLKSSDIVTAHVPLYSRTRGMFDKKAFSLMKPSAVFINTCRGPVHNEADLIEALRNRTIRAAGLDVVEVEPTPADNPLLRMENVVLTPHQAGSSEERLERGFAFSYENARRVLNGQDPEDQFEVLV